METVKNIVLTGFMGSGKTSVGKLLAHQKNFAFIDLDEEIEKKAGLKISEIFKKYGEAYFRKLEMEELIFLSNTDKHVISLGGGTFCTTQNITLAKALGVTIYLKTSISILFSRYSPEEREKRPLLKDMAKIEQLLTKREKFYSQADFTVTTDNLAIEEIVKAISDFLKEI